MSATRSYDADNHIVKTTSTQGYANDTFPYPNLTATGTCSALAAYPPATTPLTYAYYPDGKLATATHEMFLNATDYAGSSAFGTVETVHWDGDDVLFTSSGGVANELTAGKLGFWGTTATGAIDLTRGVTSVQDRDWTGSIASSHDYRTQNAIYEYGPWNSTAVVPDVTKDRVCHTKIGCSAVYAAPGSCKDGSSPCQPQLALWLTAPRLDGWADGPNIFQGVRTFDPTMAQWTTPDAYAGDVHDPVSPEAVHVERK